MVGLSALFLTIVYIGAIFLRKKFSSILHSLVGVNGGHSDQLASATGKLAQRMLLDMGLDALPILGPILGRRKRDGSGGDGLSMKDELKLWWKSRRGGKGGPAGGDIESQPPTRKPDAGECPGKPESSDFGAVEETGDRPVFIYADRGFVAPEEGVPPEPQGGMAKASWNDGGAQPTGGSSASPAKRETPGSPVREQEAAAGKENGQSSAPQFRASKLSDYYESKGVSGSLSLRPSEADPNARALSAAYRADLPRSGGGRSAGRTGEFVSPASDVGSYRSNQSAPYPEREAPEHSWAESAARTSERGAAVRTAQVSERNGARIITHSPEQAATHETKQESQRRTSQSNYLKRKTISTEEAENASSSRSERLGGKTAESEIPVRESGRR